MLWRADIPAMREHPDVPGQAPIDIGQTSPSTNTERTVRKLGLFDILESLFSFRVG